MDFGQKEQNVDLVLKWILMGHFMKGFMKEI
jgi:hypothetical protein